MSYCPGCRRELARDASFCSSCGEPAPRHEPAVETCEIVLWRGYVKAGFVAVPYGGPGKAAEPPASRLFRSRERSPAPEGAALAAHESLVEQLLRDGWEPVGNGSSWYSRTFRRPRWSPSIELSPPEDEVSAMTAVLPVPPAPAAPDPAPAPEPEPVPVAQPEPVRALEHTPEEEADRQGPSRGSSVGAVRARRWRPGTRRIGLTILAAASIGTAAAVAPTVLRTDTARGDRPLAVTPPAVHTPGTRRTAASAGVGSRPALEPVPALSRVAVSASRGDSWVEARSGSATGRILYSGTLVQGQTTRVSAKRVWLRLGAASHVDVLVNGKPASRAPLLGTIDLVLTRRGIVQG